MHMQRLTTTTARLPLPAPLALKILQAAAEVRKTLLWTPSSQPLIDLFRASLAVRVKCTFFCRAETGVRCLSGDLTVDCPSHQICLFVLRFKDV
jgi:hypothetical protein